MVSWFNYVTTKREQYTSVCTIAGLWVQSIFTVWNMSTTPSYLMRSSTMLSVVKTPVRPTPALVDSREDLIWVYTHKRLKKFRTERRRREIRKGAHLTCSGPWSVRPVRTVLWFCAPGQWSQWSPRRTWVLPVQASRWSGTAWRCATDHPAT